MSDELRPKVGIAILIPHDGKILLGKRKSEHGRGTWGLPGGHIEYGESFEDCVHRELMEETGLKVTNVRFAALTNDIYPHEKRHYVTIFMLCDYISGEAQVMEPDKCEEWQWFDWTNLPEPLFFSIQNLLKQNYNPFIG